MGLETVNCAAKGYVSSRSFGRIIVEIESVQITRASSDEMWQRCRSVFSIEKRSVPSTAKKERELFGFLPRAVCLRVFHNTIRAMRQAQEMIRRERDIYI